MSAAVGAPDRGNVLGPEQIMRLLPHRPPALLLDRIVELVPGERVTGIKAITVEAVWYEGVDGSDYSYPSSLLVESFGQAAAVLLAEAWRPAQGIGDDVPILGGVTGVHFDKAVVPGDVVYHHVRIDRVIGDNAIISGHSTVGDSTVMRIEQVILALRPRRAIT
ncbi:beta-hydroxyacyl-ACP dehydratase [Nocardia sp. MDA0666]|uniref:3-hydroxyacyl-ACP dehydratase FabZ family protein n=1 Tax=Nocardia sp. MDA0666 TaxID=2135448 RepID=UPI000D11A40C|nr:beta-hydroxyacyl-ACP dehydratase [Nocardia sp. MDA0666]PSR68668.1 beta-hydroxyacyl-ACP dehydratase [Nocardia sp. MDA0666]